MRPAMLKRLRRPVKPAAIAATCSFSTAESASKPPALPAGHAPRRTAKPPSRPRQGKPDTAPARRHVEAEHPEQEPELRRPPGLGRVDVSRGDHPAPAGLRHETRRRVARRGKAVAEG